MSNNRTHTSCPHRRTLEHCSRSYETRATGERRNGMVSERSQRGERPARPSLSTSIRSMLESSDESGPGRADARPSQRHVDHALISASKKPRVLHEAIGLENRHSLVACRCTRTSRLSSGTVCAAGVIQSACTAQQGPPYARKRAHGSHRDDGSVEDAIERKVTTLQRVYGLGVAPYPLPMTPTTYPAQREPLETA